jgi:hypothetical protein
MRPPQERPRMLGGTRIDAQISCSSTGWSNRGSVSTWPISASSAERLNAVSDNPRKRGTHEPLPPLQLRLRVRLSLRPPSLRHLRGHRRAGLALDLPRDDGRRYLDEAEMFEASPSPRQHAGMWPPPKRAWRPRVATQAEGRGRAATSSICLRRREPCTKSTVIT